MRLANLAARLVIISGDGAVDVETASSGKFGPNPQSVYERWDEFVNWAKDAELPASSPFDVADLGAPVPAPRQIFAVGLNYRDHAAEANLTIPEHPVIFTKFQSSITGPNATVELPEGTVDWEVELTVVVGVESHHVPAGQGWSRVAGLTVGQDLSERITQTRGPAPQFNLGKSFPNFSPIGPWVVTLDEFDDPTALDISSTLEVDGKPDQVLQDSNTRELIFPVADLVEKLSEIVTLYPGDVIFTGTPSGTGMGRDPKQFLQPGDVLVSEIEGIGQLRNRMVGR